MDKDKKEKKEKNAFDLLKKQVKTFDKWVTHIKHKKHDVYIGRPSVYGNPFVIGKDGTRKEVIEKYEKYLLQDKNLVEQVKKNLKGKILGCYCFPLACHGDVLAKVANS